MTIGGYTNVERILSGRQESERTRQPFFRPRRYRCSREHAVVNASLFAGFPLHRSPALCIYANVQRARNSKRTEVQGEKEGERDLTRLDF